MPKFVAACCCAIVGLEVLIAVPLITCMVVLGVGVVAPHAPGYSSGPYMPPHDPYMPASSLSPAGYLSATIPPPATVQWQPAGAPPASYASPAETCPAPTVCPVPNAVADGPPPLSPQVEAIAEVHERLGSPLADSSLAGNPAATRADTIAALEHVAAQDSLAMLPPPAAPLSEPIASLKPAPDVAGAAECPKECPSECPSKPSLVESLRAAADELYMKAQELEIDGNFGRADQIRTLAREIRTEIDMLRRESNPPVSVPLKVTEASVDPSPVSRTVRIETVNPLEPATIGLVEPAAFDAPVEPSPAAFEGEKLPQIPAP